MGSYKSELTADLCVIGSGIAGMLVAERALDGGRTVLMLERGTEMTHAERLKQRSHADPLPFNKSPHRNKQGTWEYVFRPTYNLGGSTNDFYGNMPRFHPSHFELEPFGGASRRWPITYAELEPYYLHAERRLRICGNSEHPMFNGRFDYPLPPHRLSPSDRACVQIFGADSVTQVPTVRPSRPVEGRPKCCSSNRCALCPVDSKGTALNTIYPAIRSRIGLRSGLLVTEIHCRAGRAESITAVDPTGDWHRVFAKQFVIACNGIDSCLLLQRSPDIPKHASLGHFYMDHPEVGLVIYGSGIDARPGYGDSAQTAVITSFFEQVAPELPVSVLAEVKGGELSREEGATNRNAILRDLVKLAMDKRYSKGPDFRKRLADTFRSTIYLNLLVEPQPLEGNTVEIAKIDDRGMAIPRVRIGYPDYLETVVQRVMAQIGKRLKGGEVKFVNKKIDAQHWMGATRMADSPAQGSVDRHLRYHDLDNLYVLSASTYPGVSSANPTLTLSALALRLGDHLRA